VGSARGEDIAERLLTVGVAVFQVAETLQKTALTRHLALQLVRAATSAGANYEEARYAESRADFVHKVGVAAKELAEASYWLQLLDRLPISPGGLTPVKREADELLAILVASVRTARARL
jgi:four helix bundle protein